MNQNSRYRMTIESVPGFAQAPDYLLRGLLKTLLRRYGFRCVTVAPDAEISGDAIGEGTQQSENVAPTNLLPPSST